jgi:hypothetical protein
VPVFRVKDFGLGMDADDIVNTYRKYGASTKRDSNTVQGMMGIGSKAALTYTGLFTVVGIKDGIKTTVTVTKDEDGGSSVGIENVEATDEGNGVEIIVPTKQCNYFESKARNLFRFWPEGSVLLNDKPVERVDGLWLNDNLLLTDQVYDPYVVMGNVAYPMDNENFTAPEFGGRYQLVAFVEIGDVAFTPPREALHMNSKTKAKLDDIVIEVAALRKAAAENRILAATSKFEALRAKLEADEMGIETDVLFQGEKLPEAATAGDGKTFLTVAHNKPRHSRYYNRDGKGWYREDTIPAETWAKTKWFVGYDVAVDFSPYKRKKLMLWAQANGPATTYVFLPKLPKDVKNWIDPTTVANWADVDAIKIPRNGTKSASGHITGSYNCYIDTPKDRGRGIQNGILADNINTKKPVYWVWKEEYEEYDHDYRQVILAVHKYSTIVILEKNRIPKFVRDFPTAKPLRDSVRGLADKWAKTLTPKQLQRIAMQRTYEGEWRLLKHLDWTLIDDPDLVEGCRFATEKASDADLKAMNNYKTFYRFVSVDAEWKNPLDKYPLLTHGTWYGNVDKSVKNHIYAYVNAAYAADLEGEASV